MQRSIARAIAGLTAGEDATRQYDIAAARIQSALLNVTAPVVSGLDIGVHAEPARLVGGDYIDVFLHDQHVSFGLGDASGKSLGAALNALMLRYLLRGLTQVLGHQQLGDIARHANDVVLDDFNGTDNFITLVLGTVDWQTGRLRVVNAGHEPPLILRANASDVEVIAEHGIVLGVHRVDEYIALETILEIEDRAVLYTDGLTEASNRRGELFTVERLRESLLEYRSLAAQALADALFADVKSFADETMRDDATILVLRRTAVGPTARDSDKRRADGKH